MISNRAVTEDKLAFKQKYQKGSVSLNWQSISRYCCLRRGYVFRVFYRLFDVTFRLSVILLIWLFIGGLSAGTVLLLESGVLLAFCCKTDELR